MIESFDFYHCFLQIIYINYSATMPLIVHSSQSRDQAFTDIHLYAIICFMKLAYLGRGSIENEAQTWEEKYWSATGTVEEIDLFRSFVINRDIDDDPRLIERCLLVEPSEGFQSLH